MYSSILLSLYIRSRYNDFCMYSVNPSMVLFLDAICKTVASAVDMCPMCEWTLRPMKRWKERWTHYLIIVVSWFLLYTRIFRPNLDRMNIEQVWFSRNQANECSILFESVVITNVSEMFVWKCKIPVVEEVACDDWRHEKQYTNACENAFAEWVSIESANTFSFYRYIDIGQFKRSETNEVIDRTGKRTMNVYVHSVELVEQAERNEKLVR